MGVPYFGHGTLEWIYKLEPGLVIPYYALPWEHQDHQPNISGEATFSEAGKDPLTILYQVVHVPANAVPNVSLQSHDKAFTATIAVTGSQTLPFYFALVQGYPVAASSATKKYTYSLSAIQIPHLSVAATADPEKSRYSWNRDLPCEVEIQIAVTEGTTLQRWLGWQSTPPASPWTAVSASEMTNLRRLGIFEVVPADPLVVEPYKDHLAPSPNGTKAAA